MGFRWKNTRALWATLNPKVFVIRVFGDHVVPGIEPTRDFERVLTFSA